VLESITTIPMGLEWAVCITDAPNGFHFLSGHRDEPRVLRVVSDPIAQVASHRYRVEGLPEEKGAGNWADLLKILLSLQTRVDILEDGLPTLSTRDDDDDDSFHLRVNPLDILPDFLM
jgi:hypothetical protein